MRKQIARRRGFQTTSQPASFSCSRLRLFAPFAGKGIETDVGSGHFAAPLGSEAGVDLSPALPARATTRGITVAEGVADNLPFVEVNFDYTPAVTTIWFVDSSAAMLTKIESSLG